MYKIKNVTIQSVGKDAEQVKKAHTLLVGIQNDIVNLKMAWQFLIKINIHSLYDPASLLLGICPREKKTYIHTKTSI